MAGKGDVISCDYSTVQSLYIPQANASLRVQTHGEIHSVAWSELITVLKAYPSFREEFITHLELAYNLGTEVEVRWISYFTKRSTACHAISVILKPSQICTMDDFSRQKSIDTFLLFKECFGMGTGH